MPYHVFSKELMKRAVALALATSTGLGVFSASATAFAADGSGPTTTTTTTTTTSAADAATIAQLAQMIVGATQKAKDPMYQAIFQPFLKVLSDPSFDWNAAIYGPGVTLSTSQQAAATAFRPGIQAISSFSISDVNAATAVINSVIGQLQALNSAVTTDDAVTFLQNLESQTVVSMAQFMGQSSLSVIPVETALHNAVAAVAAVRPSIETVFGFSAISGTSTGGSGTTTGGSGTTTGGSGTTTGGSGTTTGGSGTTTGGSGTTTGGSGTTTGGSGTTTGGSGTSSVTLTIAINAVQRSFNQPAASQTVSNAGGHISATTNGSTVQVAVPQNAFATPTKVTVTTADTKTINEAISGLGQAVNQGYEAKVGIGVNFTGTLKAPITLTINNSLIPAGAQVFKITNKGLVPVKATVVDGKATITFQNDPNFIVVGPKNHGGTIYFNGKKSATIPQVISHAGTTYMPIWYVMQTLNAAGFHNHWDGHKWVFTTPSSINPNLTQIKPGKGTMSIYLNNRLVENVTGLTVKDSFTGNMTTYMPIWYVMQVMKRAGVTSNWDGQNWTLKSK